MATRRPRCRWLSWDEDGRPSCEHGPAFFGGNCWKCRAKVLERQRLYRDGTGYAAAKRYAASDKGRATSARWNQSAVAQTSKQLYELTRIRGV